MAIRGRCNVRIVQSFFLYYVTISEVIPISENIKKFATLSNTLYKNNERIGCLLTCLSFHTSHQARNRAHVINPEHLLRSERQLPSGIEVLENARKTK
ncbi:hypothetical protein NPIL_180831 [Nephila pilipes]|uniref:Uncharacterized protein n=1 Tax=Nephila pilipes TaxID=299642 RepID=A0A8X6TBX1_NEPPI|nr:hypothetical protein NPIL_180831 [Nephila pilipes]